MTVWLGLYCLGMAGSVVIVVSAYMVEYKRGLALTCAHVVSGVLFVVAGPIIVPISLGVWFFDHLNWNYRSFKSKERVKHE